MTSGDITRCVHCGHQLVPFDGPSGVEWAFYGSMTPRDCPVTLGNHRPESE